MKLNTRCLTVDHRPDSAAKHRLRVAMTLRWRSRAAVGAVSSARHRGSSQGCCGQPVGEPPERRCGGVDFRHHLVREGTPDDDDSDAQLFRGIEFG